jgi:raffinose/stachyose/melibiose transport system permease protein
MLRQKTSQGNKRSKNLIRIAIIVFLSIFSIGQIFPLVWLADFSICKDSDLFGSYILRLPKHFQWSNYVTAWVDGKISQYLINSVIVNTVTIVLTVALSLMMAYAFIRMHWKLSKHLLLFVTLGMMIPIHATLLPNFITFKAVGISNSYLGLIIPYVAFSMPLAVFILTGFLESIPVELEEAAVVDGCGIFRIIFQIIFPITKPALVTVTLMTFISTWNEFIMATTYLSSDKYRTLPFAVTNFAGQYSSSYSIQFAVMTLVSIPALIIYALLNEQITKGVTMGAVKG